MKILLLVALMAMTSLFPACDELAQVQDERPPPATRMSPATPEKPRQPVRMDGTIPTTPKPADTALPADTPLPANTPLSVMTPLAVLPSYTPEATVTAVPRATVTPVSSESAKAKREEYVQRCKHWALRNMQPIEYSRFEQLDPYNMTDLERVLWGSVIVDRGQVTEVGSYYEGTDAYGVPRFKDRHVEWCQDYWSEPLNADNADKRNHPALIPLCLSEFSQDARGIVASAEGACGRYESEGMSPVIVNQYARILNWMEIDGEMLLKMDPKPRDIVRMVWNGGDSGPSRYRDRNKIGNWPLVSSMSEDVEWWGIEEAWRAGFWKNCKSYYPQLFFGRWVPLDDFGGEELLQDARDHLEVQRDYGDWPAWLFSPDRNIVVELD